MGGTEKIRQGDLEWLHGTDAHSGGSYISKLRASAVASPYNGMLGWGSIKTWHCPPVHHLAPAVSSYLGNSSTVQVNKNKEKSHCGLEMKRL